jgi:phosphoglycerate dehydrogenase-like enzyme
MPRPGRRVTVPARLVAFALATALAAGSLPARSEEAPAGASVESLIRELGLVESERAVRDRPGWQPPKRVLVWNLMPAHLDSLRAVAPGVELIPVGSPDEAIARAAGADAVLGICSAELLEAGREIRWIQSYSAGVERCVSIPALRERNVLVTNMQRVAGPVMAEHVLAMMLAFSRGLNVYIPRQASGTWEREIPEPARMLALSGKTVLVVGLGGIGTEVARRAHALGMRVVATRASGREGPDYVSYVGLPDELLKLAAEADFIVNTTPLTPATSGLFDARFFAAARPGAYFINVGRGGSVVQPDLVAALKSGRLAGAGLDVTDPEPLPATDPLWKLPNVIITPHVSAMSDLGMEARLAIAQENLRRYVAGEKMLSVVDLERGY